MLPKKYCTSQTLNKPAKRLRKIQYNLYSPPKGSNKSGPMQQVVFKCRFSLVDLKKGVVSEQWSLKAVDCLIQVVYKTGLTIFVENGNKWRQCIFSFCNIVFFPFQSKFQFLNHNYFVVCTGFQFRQV